MELIYHRSEKSDNDTQKNNYPPTPCHSKIIPFWMVFLDNIPTLFLFATGALIIKEVSAVLAIMFVLYAIFSIVWFWAKICPYCHHFGTYSCPCGYGAISSRLFQRRDSESFQKIFKRNILIVFPNWFLPFGIAVYLLIKDYSPRLLILTIIFSVIGFVIIPAISKLVGCKNCSIKEDCPWMKLKKD